MEPKFKTNTVLIIKPIKYNLIKKHMVLAYNFNNRILVHEVVGEDKNGYIMKGLNNKNYDPVSANETNIVGVVVMEK